MPFVRIFNFGTEATSPRAARFRGEGPRILFGLEGVLTEFLPVELAFGGAAGFAMGSLCGGFDCVGRMTPSFQVRLFAGYRALRWLTLGLLASWNTYVLPVPQPSWFELGPRLSLRW